MKWPTFSYHTIFILNDIVAMTDTGLEKARRKVKEFRQREQDILACALKLFLQKGEDKVTVEMIAEDAEIGKGTVYKHFQTKHEIYLKLMIQYEEQLKAVLSDVKLGDDKDKLIRSYYKFRMQDPNKYALFDRLESKCISEDAMPELINQLHDIRKSNLDQLESIVNTRIEEGMLLDCPAYFHIGAAWAFVHGAAGLSQNRFFKQLIDDNDAFFDFLMEVSVRLGVNYKNLGLENK